ncbi:uncharacterized protein [Nothobranchius furzeri]|uniref:uncharacterized protein n=1 Tax=Nothobranchius furzeri TaxID=105023 RepID=UPI002403DF74|nr:uncharacterized protein LOC129164974 [Nothobranchius furzeri]XP_054603098.1 uncharacterized protein LOC129164974 [Nothobranchius furzeri]
MPGLQNYRIPKNEPVHQENSQLKEKNADLMLETKHLREQVMDLRKKLSEQLVATRNMESKWRASDTSLQKEKSERSLLQSRYTEMCLQNDKQFTEIKYLRKQLSNEVEANKMMEEKYRKSRDLAQTYHSKMAQEKFKRDVEMTVLNIGQQNLLSAMNNLEGKPSNESAGGAKLQKQQNKTLKQDFNNREAKLCYKPLKTLGHHNLSDGAQSSPKTVQLHTPLEIQKGKRKAECISYDVATALKKRPKIQLDEPRDCTKLTWNKYKEHYRSNVNMPESKKRKREDETPSADEGKTATFTTEREEYIFKKLKRNQENV